MDDEQLVTGEDEGDQFEEVASCIRPDEEHFRWVGVWVEVGDHDDMEACLMRSIVTPCLNADRWLSTSINVSQNPRSSWLFGPATPKVPDHGGAMDPELQGQDFDGYTRCSPVDEHCDLGRSESSLDLPNGTIDRPVDMYCQDR